MQGADSSIGNVCTALLTKIGVSELTFVAGQGSVLILEGLAGSCVIAVNSNLVQYLLQTDIQKRTEKIQWKIQTLHRDFSPGNPNWENQHILYSYILLHCLQYNIHIGASGIQNPNPMTWISPKP
jgi:hypothetical protein